MDPRCPCRTDLSGPSGTWSDPNDPASGDRRPACRNSDWLRPTAAWISPTCFCYQIDAKRCMHVKTAGFIHANVLLCHIDSTDGTHLNFSLLTWEGRGLCQSFSYNGTLPYHREHNRVRSSQKFRSRKIHSLPCELPRHRGRSVPFYQRGSLIVETFVFSRARSSCFVSNLR